MSQKPEMQDLKGGNEKFELNVKGLRNEILDLNSET